MTIKRKSSPTPKGEEFASNKKRGTPSPTPIADAPCGALCKKRREHGRRASKLVRSGDGDEAAGLPRETDGTQIQGRAAILCTVGYFTCSSGWRLPTACRYDALTLVATATFSPMGRCGEGICAGSLMPGAYMLAYCGGCCWPSPREALVPFDNPF